METKRMISMLLLVMAVALGWQYFQAYEFRMHPEWKAPGQQDASTGGGATPDTQPSATTLPSMAAATPTSGPSFQPMATAAGWHVETDAGPASPASPASVTIGSEQANDPKYRMALQLDAQGAGIDQVMLNQFKQELNSPQPYTFQKPYDVDNLPDHLGDESYARSLATAQVTVDGVPIALWDQPWRLIDQSAASATYAVTLALNGKPALEIDKQYTVGPNENGDNTPQGYEVQVGCVVKNLSPLAHVVSIDFNGPTAPAAETARQSTNLVVGYDADDTVSIDYNALSDFKSGKETRDYHENERGYPLLWAGASSNYFNAIVRVADDKQSEGRFAHIVGTGLNPDTKSAFDRTAALRFTTVGFTVAPGGAQSIPLKVYFGPKSRQVLNSAYYGSFPMSFDKTLIMVSGFWGICTINWLISLSVVLLVFFHAIFRDWGIAIIALVCLIRLALHPITKRSQGSMMKMQKLAPEIERLKKHYGDDKEGFTKAQMELYKSVGFTPLLGCLPMLLQMPVFIALWRALQTTFELRQAPLHFTWIHDLSAPDALIHFAHPVNLYVFGWTLASINILPIAMAVVTFVNMKYLMPKPTASTPEQEQQQKMMQWMTILPSLMFYTIPSGANLYYLTSTSVGIIESRRIRDHLRQQDEEAKAQAPVIVDAGKIGRNKPVVRRKEIGGPVTPQKKGWLARLQEKAEQLTQQAQQAEQQRKKRKA